MEFGTSSCGNDDKRSSRISMFSDFLFSTMTTLHELYLFERATSTSNTPLEVFVNQQREFPAKEKLLVHAAHHAS